MSNQTFLFTKFNQLHYAVISVTSKQVVAEHFTQLSALLNDKKNYARYELHKLTDYFINPILNAVKRLEVEKKVVQDWSDIHELLLNCLVLILSHLKLTSVYLFYDILNINSLLLTRSSGKLIVKDGRNGQPVRNMSEEFLCASLRLTQVLFKNGMNAPTILNSFYCFNNLTTIGLLVSIFLDKLTETSSLEVRVELLACLAVLCNADDVLTPSRELNSKIGVMFASFLPGIAIKLVQSFLLGQNLKLLNHKLVCAALTVLSNVVARVLADDLLDRENYKKSFDLCSAVEVDSDGKIKDSARSLIVDRRCSVHAEWHVASSEKLFVLVERLFDELLVVNANDNYHVKMSLVRFGTLVLDKCYLTLNRYADKLLKVLIMMAANDDENNNKDSVSMEAKNGMFYVINFTSGELKKPYTNWKEIKIDVFDRK
jgi:hypothetical protein